MALVALPGLKLVPILSGSFLYPHSAASVRECGAPQVDAVEDEEEIKDFF